MHSVRSTQFYVFGLINIDLFLLFRLDSQISRSIRNIMSFEHSSYHPSNRFGSVIVHVLDYLPSSVNSVNLGTIDIQASADDQICNFIDNYQISCVIFYQPISRIDPQSDKRRNTR